MPSATTPTSTNPSRAVDELLLVVDAGGTKTAAWLVDTARPETERVLGRGRSTAGNPLSVGFPEAVRAISEAVTGARHAARRSPTDRVAGAILSIAGAANHQLHQHFLRYVGETNLAQRIAIVSDVLPVLAAGTPDCQGLAVIAGTGSVAFARARDDRTTLCGGWGYLLGDEGSGFALGRAGLQHALATLELGAERDRLTDGVLRAIGADKVLEITRTVYRSADQRSAIASIAPVVLDAAEQDNGIAQAILDAAAADLAKLVARTLKAIGPLDSPIPLAAGGGILAASRRLQQQLEIELRRLALTCDVNVVDEPLEGCIRLAVDQACAPLLTWH